jgi:quercetin dioxygenase-like cupin family protein
MEKNIDKYIVKSGLKEYHPLVEGNVNYQGVFVKSLRFDKEKQRSTTILLKFDPNSSYPYHNHPGGEELFVLQGSCEIENSILVEGDYLFTPPNYKHSVKSVSGCTLLLVVPKEVEKL